MKSRLLERCQRMIRIPSTNAHGTVKIAQFIGKELKALGFQVSTQRAKFYGASQLNLIARIGPRKGRPLIFNTHMDTVKTDPKMWTETNGNPFHPTIRKGRLYGLGAADTKLALACQCEALQGLGELRLRRPLMITATYGEEMGLVGAKKLIHHPWIRASDVVNSEPTELKPVHGNYGFRIYHLEGKGKKFERQDGFFFEIFFKGKATHSAYPSYGINAIFHALGWLKGQGDSIRILSMNGGLAPNIVAPGCSLRILSSRTSLAGLKKWGGTILSRGSLRRQRIGPNSSRFFSSLFDFLHCPRSTLESSNLGIIHFKDGRIEMVLDHRFGPDRDPQIFFREWQIFLSRCSKEGLGTYKLRIEKENPPCYAGPSSPLLGEVQTVLKSMGRETRPVMKLGCTEAGYFARRGCDVVTFGPGAAYGNAHQPNESVLIKELEGAVVFYRKLLGRLCLERD